MTGRNSAAIKAGGLVLEGQGASSGLALGPLVVLAGSAKSGRIAQGTPAEERERLDAAIAQASEDLAALSAETDDLAGEILGFQLALLQDPELLAPARERLEAGEGAEAAWRAAIGELIETYDSDEEEYFRARADDLRDLGQRVADILSGGGRQGLGELPQGAILVAPNLTPSRFLEIDWNRAGGAALAGGSATSHMAMLARARGVPLITGLGADVLELANETAAILDGEAGCLIVEPDVETATAYRTKLKAHAKTAARDAGYAAKPAVTADGAEVTLLVNVDDPAVLADTDPATCDGVGLTRTEFLFRDGLPDEESQLAAYRKVLAWAAGRPVVIRTLDAGGDKPVPGLTPAGESNPFLGLRGLRLSLARPEVFRTQLRALLRASQHGPLKIMLPMVTLPREFEAARQVFEAARKELESEGVEVSSVPLGIMVETPAAALAPQAFAADFYSIGTNDLVQYVSAAARDIDAVAELQDPLMQPVLELIERVAAAGAARDVEVSVCGEMAARDDCIPALLKAGIRALSVPPAAVGRVKRRISESLAGRRHG